MTCIAAIVHGNTVYMGADSAGVAGLDLVVRADPKVFINGDFLIGFTSSFRMGQLLRYTFNPPRYIPEAKELFEFMATDFINSVRECLKSGGYAQKKYEEEIGGCFLVGIKGRLFEIDSDYQVGESICTYNAVGCGRPYALGTLYALTSLSGVNLSPEEKIKTALLSAESFSSGVRGPFTILRKEST